MVIAKALCLFIDFLSVYEVTENYKILNDQDKLTAKLCLWAELAAHILPAIAVLLAYKSNDIFAEFNKFPEQCPRVSIMQYSSFDSSLRMLFRSKDDVMNTPSLASSDEVVSFYDQGPSKHELLGMHVNRGQIRDNSLIYA